jgi:hypothetical protein
MDIGDHVRLATADFDHGELESALLHALQAVDGTGRKLRPGAQTRDRVVGTIDDYLWVIEPMISMGANLETTTFDMVRLSKRPSRFSEIVYEVFRARLAHGEPFPEGVGIEASIAAHHRSWRIADGEITFPDTIVWALLAAVVFARCNEGQKVGTEAWVSYTSPGGLGDRTFVIDEWWGREDEVREYFRECLSRMPRVTMKF